MPLPKPKGPKAEPWKPVDWDLADAGALQALARGDASSHAQQRALKFIVESLCATYDMSYRPSGDRDTCFAEGKRYVGLQVVKLLALNLSKFKDAPGEQG